MELRMMALLTFVFLSFQSSARDKVVYGEDNRLDLYQVTDNLHYELAKSTAAMIESSSLEVRGELISVTGKSLAERGICEDQRFAKQLTAANCSGFLVAPNLLVTAGHCMDSAQRCSDYKWVFDFNVDQEGKLDHSLPKTSVYSCKRIVAQAFSRFGNKDDYALVELDREVTDRAPLRVRTEGKVATGTPLVVIGHPTGLPTKVAAGARVFENDNAVFFASNLDTFGGNSGSAVFDAQTGIVEGILVRGATDYVNSDTRNCKVVNVCSDELGCTGSFSMKREEVTRITNIEDLMGMLAE